MADPIEVDLIQGDTGPLWHIGVPLIDADGNSNGYASLANYTCTLKYVNSSGVDKTRVVSDKNTAGDKFLCRVTSDESGEMRLGLNRIVWEIRDTTVTPPYVSEVQVDLTILPQRYIPSP